MSTNEKAERIARAAKFKNLSNAVDTSRTLAVLNSETEKLRREYNALDQRLATLEAALDALTQTVAPALAEAVAATPPAPDEVA